MERFEKSPRIDRLRSRYMQCPMMTDKLSYCLDRRQKYLFTKGWLAGMGCSTTLQRRSFAYAYVLEHMHPVILEDELIVGQPDFAPLTGQEAAEWEALQPCWEAIARDFGRTDHMSLDFESLLKLGAEGLLAQIREKRSALDLTAPENLEALDFYTAAEMELTAFLKLTERYADHALQLAQTASEPRKSELLEISAMLRRVPAKHAQSFYEALQSIHFYTLCLWGLYQCGHPDRYLLPWYEKDIEAGRLTPFQAQELIDCFCLMYTTYIVSKSSVGFMIGGEDETGANTENALTWHFLNSIPHTNTADPSIGLCVNDRTGKALLEYAATLLTQGYSHPAIYNDKRIIEALEAYGVPHDDARSYIHSCCVEITIDKKSCVWTVSPYHNTLLWLLEVLRQNPAAESLEALLEAYTAYANREIRRGLLQENLWQLERSRNGNEPLMVSCLVQGCIDSGRGIHAGGAAYNWIQPNFLGIANTADSLLAIQKLVFEAKQLTIPELLQALEQNFEGHEPLRQQLLRSIPHFGNGDADADAMYRRITELLEAGCKGLKTYRGSTLMPSAFSYNEHMNHGSRTPATPDGRRSGEPLADGSGPVQGRDTQGPTALLRSVTAWDQGAFLGGVAVNLRVNKCADDTQTAALTALIRSFLQLGGVELQVNATDPQELRAAMETPEQYGHLVVRIGGYSDYFTSLTPALQKEVLTRTTQSL